MKKLGMVITCLVMILLLVSCANKRKDLVLSNFPSVQNELTEKDLLKAVGAPLRPYHIFENPESPKAMS